MTAVVPVTEVIRKASPAWLRSGVLQANRLAGTATSSLRPLPDFLVIGTKRGGTTTMLLALQDHPLVLRMVPSAADIKSPHYFDLEYGRGEAWYRSYFPTTRARHAVGTGSMTGESSPYYLFHPLAPSRVAVDLPAVRLIVLLRDPVQRAFSHHWDRVKAGIETMTFEEAIDAEPSRLAGERQRLVDDPFATSERFEHFSYVERGQYVEQLRDWFHLIPRERFLVMRSEDLYREPQATYDRALEFLGLPPHRRSGEFGRHHGHADRPTVAPDTAERLRVHFAPYNRQLADLLGEDEPWW